MTDKDIQTPRTDALVKPRLDFTNDESVYDAYKTLADFARQLERELLAKEAGGVVEALRELVRLKDLHDEIEKIDDPMNFHEPEELALMEAEYATCKPLAWDAARKALAAAPARSDDAERDAVLEEAAKVCEALFDEFHWNPYYRAGAIKAAEAIRAMKGRE